MKRGFSVEYQQLSPLFVYIDAGRKHAPVRKSGIIWKLSILGPVALVSLIK